LPQASQLLGMTKGRAALPSKVVAGQRAVKAIVGLPPDFL
jgi:hypothetical protein